MDLVAAPASPTTPAGADVLGKSLEAAVDEFRDILTDSQRQKLSAISHLQDAQGVLIFTAQLDRENQLKKGRGIASRLHTLLQSVQAFSAIVDTYVSSKPDIAALVWGSIKLSMLIAVNYTSYFESLSGLFMTLGAHCPRFAEYQALFPASSELQKALCDFHAAIVRCCKHALEAIQRPWQKQLKNAFRQSFEQEFKPDISNIERLGKEVKATIVFAKTKADREEHDLQQKERAAAAKHRLTLGKFISQGKGDLETIRKLQLQQSERDSRLERQKLLESLSSHDHLAPFKEACKKRQGDTAEWILSTSKFTHWYNGTGESLLWCSGKIGSGKTILCANVINYVLARMDDGCHHQAAFFFLQHDNTDSLKAETLVRSIIRQTLENVNTLPEHVESQLQALHPKPFVSLGDWVELLQRRVRDFGSFFIFVDGLDEYEPADRHDALDALSSLTRNNPGLRIFVASRASVQSDLKRKFRFMEHVSMAGDSHSSDIRLYVEATIQERILNGDLVCGDPGLLDTIKTTLSQHADGMFLWATFLIREVCLANCDDDIRQCLRSLPRDLEETFARALLRIVSRGHGKLAQNAFLWLVAAKRPLTLSELGEAVTIEIKQPHSMPGRQVHQMDRLVSWCENLVQVAEEQPQFVQFAHKTIRDFITDATMPDRLAEFHVDPDKADHFAGEICVTYLHFNDFKTTIARRTQPLHVDPIALSSSALGQGSRMADLARRLADLTTNNLKPKAEPDLIGALENYRRLDANQSLNTLQQSHHFLNYAVKYWIHHTTRFRQWKSLTWGLWRQIIASGHNLAQIPWQESTPEETENALLTWSHQNQHFALLRYASTIPRLSIARGELMNRSVEDGSSQTLSILLEAVKASQDWLSRAVIKASARGHLQVIEVLIGAGANVNSVGPNNQTAVQWAWRRGYVEVVSRLVDAGADAKRIELDDWIAVDAATTYDHLRMVQMMIDAGADVNSVDDKGWTALRWASRFGDLEVVNRLIDAGADVDGADKDGWTALRWASIGGSPYVVERLINAGADVNKVERHGWTALDAARAYGHLQVIRILEARGSGQ